MHNITDECQADPRGFRQSPETCDLMRISIDQTDPLFLLGRIAAHRILKQVPDDRLWRVFEACPEAFGFRDGGAAAAGGRRFLRGEKGFHYLLWRPHEPVDFID